MQITEKYDAHPHYVELARMFSSVKIMGPPMSEKLLDLIIHLFSLEEAGLCLHLSFIFPKTPIQIARNSGCHEDKILPILEEMYQKRIIIKIDKRYMLYPLIPGTFEHILKTGVHSDWHYKYAELINDLFYTGYMGEYFSRPINAIRNIPVQQSVVNKSFVGDADLISELIESHEKFAVLNACPCRQSMHLTGHKCMRASPDDGCLTFGEWSHSVAADGNGRTVSKIEMYDIIEERWEKKLVFFTSNVLPTVPTAVCTCCDCCCHALEIVNKFSMNLLAPSHFVVKIDESTCNNCGKCITACNTHAHYFENSQHVYNPEKCIGCGNCTMLCRNNAIKMIENRSYKTPSKNHVRLILKMLAPIVLMGTRIKLARYFSGV